MIPTPWQFGALHGRAVAGEQPGFLFVHGNSADHRAFEHLLAAPALARWHRVALDLPGHGASALTEPVRVADLTAAIGAAAAACGAAVVFGHSLGGHLALQALARGELPGVRGVAVLGTPPIPDPARMGEVFVPTPAMGLIFQGALSDDEVALWGAATFGPHGAPAPWFGDAVRATHPALRPGLAASVAAEGLADEVAVLDGPVPVAVLHAADDAFCAPAHMAGLRGRALWRGATQVLPGRGHYAPWEAADEVAAALAAFHSDVLQ